MLETKREARRLVSNEPIEHATQTTGVTTAGEALRICKLGHSYLSLSGYADPTRASWSDAWIWSLCASHEKRSVKTQHEIQVPGYVSNGSTSERDTFGYEGRTCWKFCEAYRPVKGFWSLFGEQQNLIDLLSLLPKAAPVASHVYLDGGTTQNHISAAVPGESIGLHTDFLYLVTPGKTELKRFLIDVQTGPHNCARFGKP